MSGAPKKLRGRKDQLCDVTGTTCCQAKRVQVREQVDLPEGQGQNLALTAVYVPYSLDSCSSGGSQARHLVSGCG